MAKYYEIICETEVIGVCCDQGNGDDTLLHVARQDRVVAFGQITKTQFEQFGDNSWVKPISKKRWKPNVKFVLEMERIK